MIDWNGDGKIDATDWALTDALLSDDDNRGGKSPSGCCGPTAALVLLLIGVAGGLLHVLSGIL